jgi:probable FeS assembly SUF system protein SufT
MDDFIPLKRAVEATQIPSGQVVTLPEGTVVSITQSLGGAYTVHASIGGLYRLTSQDADALGLEVAPKAVVAEGDFSEELVWGALKEVYDPEIPVNIVDLGLIYSMKAEPVEGQEAVRKVTVEMTLTAPGCGMGPVIQSDVEKCVRVLPGVASVNVEVVLDPPWSREMMSEVAQVQLGLF